jgi:integrator complex subunit 7
MQLSPPNSLYPLFNKDYDYSRIFQELDKGLRSPKIGERCEAIIFFGRLMSQLPFPLVINTTMLKLSDLFRVR